jgi:hypothetical protein
MSMHNISAKFGDSGYTKRTVETTATGGIGSGSGRRFGGSNGQSKRMLDLASRRRKANLAKEIAAAEAGLVDDKKFDNFLDKRLAEFNTRRAAISQATDGANLDVPNLKKLGTETISSAVASGNITTTGAGSFADLESEHNFIPTQSTQTIPITAKTIFNPSHLDQAEYDRLRYRADLYIGANAFTSLVTDAQEAGRVAQIGASQDSAGTVAPSSAFVAKPQLAYREPRPTWAQLQKALQDRIIPNELYEDANGEYELTTYNITIFMLEEGIVFNKRLSTFSRDIKNIDDVKRMGGIILAQSAGSDQFYIDNVTFTTAGLSGPGAFVSTLDFTINSPYQADWPDHIFKAGEKLGIRNHTDFPIHMLIEWKGRDAKTSKATKPTTFTSRCYALALSDMDLTMDEAGGSYAVRAFRASERGLGQDKAYLKRDITISGETLGEVLQELVGRLQNVTAKEERNVWVNDVYNIEIPAEWQDWKVRTSYEQKFSTLSSNINGSADASGSTTDSGGTQINPAAHANSANTSPIDTFDSQKFLNESEMVRTFVFKTGEDILSIIQKILNTAAKFQQLLVGDEYDLQEVKAVAKRTSPENIWKFYAKIDVDVEYIGYDKNTRQYACKRIYEIIKHHDPLLGANEETTLQTVETSKKRLHEMLNKKVIRKAYTYYYTGLNTEIKNLELKFDNHYVIARNMGSNKGSSGKRQHGLIVDPASDIAVGGTSEIYNDAHDKYEQHIGAVAGDIIELDKKLDTIATDVRMNIYSDTKAQADKFNNATTRRAVQQAQLDGFKQYQGITEAQLDALEAGKLQINLEGTYTDDSGKLIMDAGRYYFTEKVDKIMSPGLHYVGDLQKKNQGGVLFPVKFANTMTTDAKTGTNDDAHQGGNIISEIIAQRKGGHMLRMDLEIRGDPFWIPQTMSGINESSISPAHQTPMLLIIAGQSSDFNNAGLFQIDERNSISAVYNVLSIANTFSAGEFSQTLLCARDVSIDVNSVIRAPDKMIFYNEHGFGPDIGGT